MSIISLSTLTSYCQSFLTMNFSYYQELREAFYVLYTTGCRITEIFEIDRWSHVSGYTVTFWPQKGNLQRTITLNPYCANFIEAIKGQYAPFLGRTSSQLNQFYVRNKQFGTIFSGEKEISFYIFRYRFIKQLYADGYDVSHIAAFMGYTSIDTPNAYLAAVISEQMDAPPVGCVQLGNIWIQSNNVAVNDEGSGIYIPSGAYASMFGYLYTRAAAERIVSFFPGFHLMNIVDENYFYQWVRLNVIPAGKFKNPCSLYWRSVTPASSNHLGLNIRGSGVKLSNGAYNPFTTGSFHTYLGSPTQARTLQWTYGFDTMVVSPYKPDDFCSVRLIRNVI